MYLRCRDNSRRRGRNSPAEIADGTGLGGSRLVAAIEHSRYRAHEAIGRDLAKERTSRRVYPGGRSDRLCFFLCSLNTVEDIGLLSSVQFLQEPSHAWLNVHHWITWRQ